MLRSMTAFGRAETAGPWGRISWELRSVNHRYLEPSVRIPEELRAIEPRVRERLAARLSRGKVDCTLRFAADAGQVAEVEFNDALARSVIEAWIPRWNCSSRCSTTWSPPASARAPGSVKCCANAAPGSNR